MTFLPSKIPLIQAPMASAQGPELAIAVCRAGGLGSLPAAMLTPERLRDAIAKVRKATGAPFNVNFFCHAAAAHDPEIETRWRKRLAPYYAEAGIDPSAVPAGPVRAPFDAALCAVIEEARPAVVSFHFGLPPLTCFRASKRSERSSFRPPPRSPRRAGSSSMEPTRSLPRAGRQAAIAACSSTTTSTRSRV